MYQNVLIPTDGSAGVEESVSHGVAIAEQFGATVHGLYVVDQRTPGLFGEYTHASFGENVREEITSELEAEGREATAEVREAAAEAGLDAREAVVTGIPHESIVD
jgi:nucleotide-binding universal stress UspA family protein